MSAVDDKINRLESLFQTKQRELEDRLEDTDRKHWMPRVHQVHIAPPTGADADELAWTTGDSFPSMWGVHLDLRGVLYYRGFRTRWGLSTETTKNAGVSCAIYTVLTKDNFIKSDPNVHPLRLKKVAELGTLLLSLTRDAENTGFLTSEKSEFRDHIIDPRLGEYFCLFQVLSGTTLMGSPVNAELNPCHEWVPDGAGANESGVPIPSRFGEWPDTVRWRETIAQTPMLTLLSAYGQRFWRTS